MIAIYIIIFPYVQVQELYAYLPRSVVHQYVKLCKSCTLRKPQTTLPLLKPIVANGFFLVFR